MNSRKGRRSACADYLVLYIILCHLTPRIPAVRAANKCMRHYFVETIKHPTKDCELKNVLMSKCEGYCPKSKTVPLISFNPILHVPFRYRSKCCRDQLSVMRAVSLRCKGEGKVYATYRYIIRCGCSHCRE